MATTKGDTGVDPVEDESVAFGLGRADVGLRVNFDINGTTIAQFAVDRCARVSPAALVGKEGVIDDDPEFIIGKFDRPTVFIPRSPGVG